MMQKQRYAYPLFGLCVFLSSANTAQKVYGHAGINDTVVSNEIELIGVGHLKNTTFKKTVRVLGCLHSEHNRYLSDIYSTGAKLYLVNDQVNGDVHITNYIKTPRLKLRGSSIKGRVIFHGRKPGQLEMDQSSSIGQLENGVRV